MITVFVRIPEWFVERYDDEISAWAENFGKIGPVKSIVLREGVFSDPSPDEDRGPVLVMVKLLARMERQHGRVTVAPYTEQDAELIAKHCEKMLRLNISPRKRLVEPARPWVPFMPGVKGNGHT